MKCDNIVIELENHLFDITYEYHIGTGGVGYTEYGSHGSIDEYPEIDELNIIECFMVGYSDNKKIDFYKINIHDRKILEEKIEENIFNSEGI